MKLVKLPLTRLTVAAITVFAYLDGHTGAAAIGVALLVAMNAIADAYEHNLRGPPRN